jgi:hypothetical protein
MISREPDKAPDFDEHAARVAMSLGYKPVSITCNEPGAKVGDATGIHFIAFLSHTPRVGELIELEDGTLCEVADVAYVMNTISEQGASFIVGTINVRAVATGRKRNRKPRQSE